MTSPTIDPCDSYVYALLRDDGVTPFYIGKGHGRRMLIHERDAHKGNSHKDRVIQKMHASGHRVVCEKLIEGLSDAEARQVEMDLIALLLRWPNGPLANLTDGGDGARNTPTESRAKQAAANRRTWGDPEVRAKRLAGMIKNSTKGRLMSEETKAKMREAAARRKASQPPKIPKPPRAKKDRVAEIKKFWADPVKREAAIERRKKWHKDHPATDAQRRANSERMRSDKGRESLAKTRATNALPDVRKRRIEAQRIAFSTPEAKAKRSEASKKAWAARKAQKTAPEDSAMLSQLVP